MAGSAEVSIGTVTVESSEGAAVKRSFTDDREEIPENAMITQVEDVVDTRAVPPTQSTLDLLASDEIEEIPENATITQVEDVVDESAVPPTQPTLDLLAISIEPPDHRMDPFILRTDEQIIIPPS